MSENATIPSFVSYSGITFTFHPDYTIATQTVTLDFLVSDSLMITAINFQLNVINQPPYFTPEIAALEFSVLSTGTYSPSLTDPEGNSVLISGFTSNCTFLTLRSDSKTFEVSAPVGVPDQTWYQVNFIFTDGINPVSQAFSFVILNKKPFFIAPIVDQVLYHETTI